MSGAAGSRLGATQPPPKRQRGSGSGAGSAFPLAGCLVYMPHASQLSAAGLDASSWIVGIPRLGGSLTHNHRRAASVTHALVPSVAPPAGGSTWAWLPAELLPGSAVAAPGLLHVTPAWAADCIAWRERRPEADYAPAERYCGFPAAATAAPTVAAPAAAGGAGAATLPTPATSAPAARRASHAAPTGHAAGHTGAAAHVSRSIARAAPTATYAIRAAAHAAGATSAPPQELAQFSGHAARCVGCLLGVLCGDVLGAPVEAKGRHDWTKIRAAHPGGMRDFVADIRYTDDTQMTIALVKSLVACGCCDHEHCAREYGREEHNHWIRGYSRATRDKLRDLYRGRASWRTSGTDTWGNGAVMRIAPIGLAYRNASPAVLRTAVYHAVVCTHDSEEALDAAACQAAAVAALCKSGVSGPAVGSSAQLIEHLLALAETQQLRSRLRAISNALAELPPGSDTAAVRSQVWEGKAGHEQWEADMRLLNQVVSDKGPTCFYQTRASDSVACALWALCRHWGHPEAVIVGAVHQGGDTDTVAAIAGALAGAQAVCAWVPHRWWSVLKTKINNPHSGATALVGLAQRLARLDVRQ